MKDVIRPDMDKSHPAYLTQLYPLNFLHYFLEKIKKNRKSLSTALIMERLFESRIEVNLIFGLS